MTTITFHNRRHYPNKFNHLFFLFLVLNSLPIQLIKGRRCDPTKPIDSTKSSKPNKVAMVNKIDPNKFENG